MSEISLMISIVEREKLPAFIQFYEEMELQPNFVFLGHGTATHSVADILPTSEPEKAIVFTPITKEEWKETKKGLLRRLQIDIPGIGIAFIVPISSVGGPRELKYLTHGQDLEREEESIMKNTDQELLVAISNQGYNSVIMDAARQAGAGGGTILHAQGTGRKEAEKFLGISLASEKDVLFIVVKTKNRNKVMQAIMEKAGIETEAKGVVFSLPITDTAGCRFLHYDDEEEPHQ